MKSWWFLLAHELRSSRSSIIAAAVLQLVILSLIHYWVHDAAEAASAAAVAVSVLTALWTLHMAADSFAADLASGRLASRALLPVSAGSLCSAKIGSLLLSIAGLTVFALAFECAVSAWLSGSYAAVLFLAALPPAFESIAGLSLIAALGVLCSLLVENALTALLLTSLSLGLLWGLSRAMTDALYLIGKRWTRGDWSEFGLLIAVLLLALGLWAFSRAQKRLGAASLRARTVLIGVLFAMALLGGTAAAAAWSFGAHGLQSRRVQIYPAVASPDGRFIAFETQFSLPHDSRTYKPLAVWVLDVERAEPRLVAWAGRLPRNVHGGFQEPWSDELGLQVTRYDPLNAPDGATTLRLDIENGALREREITELQHGASPHVPEWAQWTRGIATERDHYTLRVRWKGTEFERVFRGDWQHSQLARGVLLSPTPGRALARREDRLVLIDFASEQETVLVEGLSKFGLLPSPDAKAVLVRTETHTHVLSTLDGKPLHAPWPYEEWRAEWITGDERSHEVHLCSNVATGLDRIVDLEAKREFSIPMFPLGYVTRLADRGYVLLSASEDLVLLDREGRPIKVLLTRDRP